MKERIKPKTSEVKDATPTKDKGLRTEVVQVMRLIPEVPNPLNFQP